MKISPKIVSVIQNAMRGSVASTIFNLFMGRCTFFAILFSSIGIYGWLKGRDLTSYAIFVTAIQGLLVAHSLKQDIHDQRMARLELDAPSQITPPSQ